MNLHQKTTHFLRAVKPTSHYSHNMFVLFFLSFVPNCTIHSVKMLTVELLRNVSGNYNKIKGPVKQSVASLKPPLGQLDYW